MDISPTHPTEPSVVRPVDPASAPEPDLVDTRDMVVVHTALLREFRLAPSVVAGVAPDDRNRARTVERHLQLICELMHHHHTGEDELLWPVLEPRLAPTERAQVVAAEAQHSGLDRALGAVTAARAGWVATPDEGPRDRLVAALTRLHELLAEHLEFEERQLLPMAAAHLSHEEWHAIGAAGARSVGKRSMLLVLGMFAYEGDPLVVKAMLADAPPPVRVVVPRLAARSYARYARELYGTPRP